MTEQNGQISESERPWYMEPSYFDSEKEYLEDLNLIIEDLYLTRTAFCSKHGIPESSLSYLLSGKKRMRHLECKVLKALGFRKEVITKISITVV